VKCKPDGAGGQSIAQSAGRQARALEHPAGLQRHQNHRKQESDHPRQWPVSKELASQPPSKPTKRRGPESLPGSARGLVRHWRASLARRHECARQNRSARQNNYQLNRNGKANPTPMYISVHCNQKCEGKRMPRYVDHI